MQLDDALFALGAYGRYQMLVYLAISVFDNLPSIWHMSISAFLNWQPEHRCKISEGASVNQSFPTERRDGEVRNSQCEMYEFANGTYDNRSVGCTNGWYYSQDPVKTSIVTDWDLVCDKNVLPETSVMVFNFGVMFGAIFFGFMSDKYGRKKSFIFALVTQSLVGSATSLSPSLAVYTLLRFFVGALEQGVNITGYIMATEMFPPRQRTILGVSHEFLWAIGGAILPVMAYFLREWRYLQLAASLPSILGLFLWWVIPESVVWLLAKGRIKEAEAILGRAAKFNNKTLPEHCLSDHETQPMLPTDGAVSDSKQPQVRTYTVVDLFRTPNLRRITVCLCSLWALNTMVYYGLSYNTPNLKGDVYFNFFIGQMVEIPSVAFTMLVIYRIGRRWPLCLFHVFGGIVCIASPFVPKEVSGYDLTWVSVTLAMLGKFAINASFTIIYIYGPEIYPTVLRNTGSGLASFSGRFGGILYPFINYLSKLNIGSINTTGLPMIVFGALSIAGGFLALPLPETRHRPLPETVEDVEHYEEFCKRMEHHEAAAAAAAAAAEKTPGAAAKSTELNVIGKPGGENV